MIGQQSYLHYVGELKMAAFDITTIILNFRPDSYDVFYRGHNGALQSVLASIKTWLVETVGEYYGPGDDNVLYIGSGWEIFRLYDGKPGLPHPDHDTCVTWHVDITDEAQSVMFALKWIK